VPRTLDFISNTLSADGLILLLYHYCLKCQEQWACRSWHGGLELWGLKWLVPAQSVVTSCWGFWEPFMARQPQRPRNNNLLAMVQNQTSVHCLHGMVMALWRDCTGLDILEPSIWWGQVNHGGTPAISAMNINWADVHARGNCRRPGFDSTGPVYKGHLRLSDTTCKLSITSMSYWHFEKINTCVTR
jgi:hypothetical protein